MKFEIILNSQTPKAPEVLNIQLFIRENKELLNSFLGFAQSKKTAVGLSANQISLDGERIIKRFFAYRDISKDEWKIVIDPSIVQFGMVEQKLEGCLTWKDNNILAERSKKVKASYYTMTGEFIEGEIYEGFNAQIWQHELDHINGVEEQIMDKDYRLPKSEIGRNDRCPCDSGKKYKRCCFVRPVLVSQKVFSRTYG